MYTVETDVPLPFSVTEYATYNYYCAFDFILNWIKGFTLESKG